MDRELQALASAFEVLEPAQRQTRGGVAPPDDGDIMALAFIVMKEAAKSAREDLKAIMDDVKFRRGVFVLIGSDRSDDGDDD